MLKAWAAEYLAINYVWRCLALGYGLGALIASNIPSFPDATIPLWAAVLALGFSAFVGVIFGILPAAKAANLDPIEALRYE